MYKQQGDPAIQSGFERPSAASLTDRSNRHDYDNSHREDGFGSVTTLVHPPVKVMSHDPPHSPFSAMNSGGSGVNRSFHSGIATQFVGRIPKLNFPTFDGDNPRLWTSRCEIYFEMCPLEPDRWIKVATMHFLGVTSRWLMSVQHKLKTYS